MRRKTPTRAPRAATEVGAVVRRPTAARRLARVVVAVGLLAPPVAWLGFRVPVATSFASPVAEGAAVLAAALETPPPPDPVSFPLLEALEPTKDHGLVQQSAAAEAASERSSERSAPTSGRRAEEVTVGGLFVPRRRLMAIVEAGARPSSAGYAPATAWRPAGTVLAGVGGLGVGLRDGDVVTRVGGAQATSPNAVVGAVGAALRRQAPAIDAEVWRDRHRISLTVELPKLRPTGELEAEEPSTTGRSVRGSSSARAARETSSPGGSSAEAPTPR